MATKHRILDAFQQITVWKQGGQRAPHKPLLLLFALGRVQRGHRRLVQFTEVEAPLTELLKMYGPSRGRQEPQHPFWHLRKDGLWEIPGGDQLTLSKNKKRPLIGELRKADGGFPDTIYQALHRSPDLVRELAEVILEEHFQPTVHGDLLKGAMGKCSRSSTATTTACTPGSDSASS